MGYSGSFEMLLAEFRLPSKAWSVCRSFRFPKTLLYSRIMVGWRLFLTLALSFPAMGSVAPNAASPASPPAWVRHARRLTGESDAVRSCAIQELKADPKLAEALRAAFATQHRFLALDVIGALKLRSFLPELLKGAEKDESGFFYHCINQISQPADYPEMVRVYKDRLLSRATSIASRVALLDSLSRLNAPLEEGELKDLLTDEAYEVRSAALYYIRHALLRRRSKEYVPLIKKALGDPTYQLRVQALYLISDLPLRLRRNVLPSLSTCESDPSPPTQELCLKLLGEGR